MNILMFGPNGSGKGTQGTLVKAKYNLDHIESGAIFRKHIGGGTELGMKAKEYINRGELVPDDITIPMVLDVLQNASANGWLLDGFPRNHAQAEFFLESYDIDAVINIEVPDVAVLQRVLSRRLCSGCGVDYNLIHHRPSVANRCDMCGGELVARADDTEETISKRIADFHTQTQPVLDLFSRKELIVTVDGTSTAEAVQQQIRLNLRLAPVPEAPLDAHAGSGPAAPV